MDVPISKSKGIEKIEENNAGIKKEKQISGRGSAAENACSSGRSADLEKKQMMSIEDREKHLEPHKTFFRHRGLPPTEQSQSQGERVIGQHFSKGLMTLEHRKAAVEENNVIFTFPSSPPSVEGNIIGTKLPPKEQSQSQGERVIGRHFSNELMRFEQRKTATEENKDSFSFPSTCSPLTCRIDLQGTRIPFMQEKSESQGDRVIGRNISKGGNRNAQGEQRTVFMKTDNPSQFGCRLEAPYMTGVTTFCDTRNIDLGVTTFCDTTNIDLGGNRNAQGEQRTFFMKTDNPSQSGCRLEAPYMTCMMQDLNEDLKKSGYWSKLFKSSVSNVCGNN